MSFDEKSKAAWQENTESSNSDSYSSNNSNDDDSDSSSGEEYQGAEHDRKSVFLPKAGLLLLHVQDRALMSGFISTVNPQLAHGESLSELQSAPMVSAFCSIRKILRKVLGGATFPKLHVKVGPEPGDFASGFHWSRGGQSSSKSSRKVAKGERIADIPWVLGPQDGCSFDPLSASLQEWIEEAVLGTGIDELVLGGARLSSSIVNCALSIAKQYSGEFHTVYAKSSGRTLPNLRVIVDLSICGDEARMYRPLCASCTSEYETGLLVQCSHHAEAKLSPVEISLRKLEKCYGIQVLDEAEPFEWSSEFSFWSSLVDDSEVVEDRAVQNGFVNKESNETVTLADGSCMPNMYGGRAAATRTKLDDVGLTSLYLKQHDTYSNDMLNGIKHKNEVSMLLEYERWKRKFMISEQEETLEEKAKAEANHRAEELQKQRVETWRMKKEDLLSQTLRSRFLEFEIQRTPAPKLTFGKDDPHRSDNSPEFGLQHVHDLETIRLLVEEMVQSVVVNGMKVE